MSKDHFIPIHFTKDSTPLSLMVKILETFEIFGPLEQKKSTEQKLIGILRNRGRIPQKAHPENITTDSGEPVAKKSRSQSISDSLRHLQFTEVEKLFLHPQMTIINEFFLQFSDEIFSETKIFLSKQYRPKGIIEFKKTSGKKDRNIILKEILRDVIETLVSYCQLPALTTSTSESSPASFVVPTLESASDATSESFSKESLTANSPTSINEDEEIMKEEKNQICFYPQRPSLKDLVSLSTNSLHQFNPYIPMQSRLNFLEELALSDPTASRYFLEEGRFPDPSAYMVYGKLPPHTAPSSPVPSSELDAPELDDTYRIISPEKSI